MNRLTRSILGALVVLGLGGSGITLAQQSEMTFFITSVGSGKGGNLGGLAGADKQCQMLAQAVGAGGRGAAMVGHHDRQGLRDDDASKSWNSSHPTRGLDGGCSQNDLKGTGGNGLFYCFATK
jgi:hypothetical protein